MTTQYSIPIARLGANGFYPSRFFNPTLNHSANRVSGGVTFKFDTPIPAGVIPSKKRQPRPKAPPIRKPNKLALGV